ncbi:MAG: 3-deoxy-manno-octulosonate cytidylyltransferase [Bacteroidetes bacterium]|nr:3-deoxy-manno-octulosonate cytidylyltransferase [Bacteroidota bacterium]
MKTDKQKVIGIIPSRYASQRLSVKPLIDLLGKPMVQRVYEQTKKARLLNDVIVATDDPRIEKCVIGFGGEVILTSTDIQSGSDRVAAAASQIEGDIFVNIQGDEPLIAPEMIDQAVQLLLDDPEAQVGTLVRKIDKAADVINPNIVKAVLSHNMHALYFSRSAIPFVRDEPDEAEWLNNNIFYKHIGLYVFRRDFLMQYAKLPDSKLEKAEKLEQLRILEAGYRIKTGITKYDSVPIDTKEDVERVVKILNQINTKY